MIGVGGIGAGSFFALEGNRTLGREESRGGTFLDQKDCCKLHIVSHYVSRLTDADFTTLAIGQVGEDDVGLRLIKEMQECGIDTRYVKRSPEHSTLFSFCFSYPDGSGGNLTTNDSASSLVDPIAVKQAEEDFLQHQGAGIAVALPEVPLSARAALLDLGTRHNFFKVASFTSEEIPKARDTGLFQKLDLVALNTDEARALIETESELATPSEIATQAISLLNQINPKLQILLTAGTLGSWGWDTKASYRCMALPVDLVNSAGAGDAYLAGTLVGLSAALDFRQAQQLGNLVAALSVTSRHTIHFGIDRASLANLANETGAQLGDELKGLLGIV
jgi:sugar/nucleoside kinase (ribokinase family)